MKHFAYLLPVCCLLFAACRKDSPATEIIPTSHNCSGRKTSRRLRTPGTPIFRSNSIPGCRSRATP